MDKNHKNLPEFLHLSVCVQYSTVQYMAPVDFYFSTFCWNNRLPIRLYTSPPPIPTPPASAQKTPMSYIALNVRPRVVYRTYTLRLVPTFRKPMYILILNLFLLSNSTVPCIS